MSPRPPRSTPLPYTTLFRSGVAVAHGLARAGPLLPAGLEGEDLGLRRDADQAEVGVQRGGDHPCHRGAVDVAVEAGIDRKSTRLNSRHHIISYADSCLEDKT